MKKFAKRAAALLLALILTFSFTGCYSEGKTWAAKMGDITLPTGGYIYFLSAAYEDAAALVDSDKKVLKTEIEGQKAEDWIRDRTMDYVNRFFWVENEMQRLGLTLDEKDMEEVDLLTTTYWTTYGGADIYDEYGISRESFDLIYSQYNVKYLRIFEALYGEGGEFEVPIADMEDHYNSTYYNYEYFTVPMALPDEEGNPVEMTEEEAADLAEELEEIRTDIEKGKLTVEEAAEKYAEKYHQEKSSYVSEINNAYGMTMTYTPAEFATKLSEMVTDDVTVFEADQYMIVLKKLQIEGTAEEKLANPDDRSSILIELKSAEYAAYVEEQAAAMSGIEVNTKAIKSYKPKMFAEAYPYGYVSTETAE